LVIAKLDRLARNVAFISNLMESGVEFHAVDFPQANRLTVHILAAVAEHEAKMISERTKAALAAAKRRGVKLGGYRGTTMTKATRKAASEAITKRQSPCRRSGTDDRRAAGGRRYATEGHCSGPQRARHPYCAWYWDLVRDAGYARVGAPEMGRYGPGPWPSRILQLR
jgi:hypothetical protein